MCSWETSLVLVINHFLPHGLCFGWIHVSVNGGRSMNSTNASWNCFFLLYKNNMHNKNSTDPNRLLQMTDTRLQSALKPGPTFSTVVCNQTHPPL